MRDLKALYLKEVESKSELELIIRKNVEKIKHTIKPQSKSHGGGGGGVVIAGSIKRPDTGGRTLETFTKEMREGLIEQLLNDEKILTLIYDKTFYPDFKGIVVEDNQIPEAMQGAEENWFTSNDIYFSSIHSYLLIYIDSTAPCEFSDCCDVRFSDTFSERIWVYTD